MRVEPRLHLALATAPGVDRRELRETRVEHRELHEAGVVHVRVQRVPPVETVVRLSLAGRDRRIVETRVARGAETVLRRTLARARRLEPGAAVAVSSDAPGHVPPVAPALPGPPLVIVPRRAPATTPREEAAVLAGASGSAHAALRTGLRADANDPAPVPAATLDLERLTESVIDAIDRRVVARRERMGRL